MASLKGIFKAAFPYISSAAVAGGPIAVMAAGAVGKVLGVEVKPEEIEDRIASATAKDPEIMLKLKEAEQQFQLQMTKLGFDSAEKIEAIQAEDRANARAREIAVRDKIPAFLAIATTIGFFGLLGMLLYHEPPPSSKDILNIMVGVLGTAWVAMVTYYFGSSAGSAAKTSMMANGK